jgi:hypothetical protein
LRHFFEEDRFLREERFLTHLDSIVERLEDTLSLAQHRGYSGHLLREGAVACGEETQISVRRDLVHGLFDNLGNSRLTIAKRMRRGQVTIRGENFHCLNCCRFFLSLFPL